MKLRNKISILIVAAISVAGISILGGTSTAAGEGQIEGGDIYRVRNVTKGSAYANAATADKCESVQYKLRLHNPGPGEVTNVNVKVNFPAGATTQHVSTATVTSQNAQPTTTTDTATVNLSQSLALAYTAGSTQLLDTNSNVISSLPDGVTQGGINIGTVGVSLQQIKFVQFTAKVDCPETPPPVQSYKCDALNVTKVDRTKFNFTATASVQNVTIQNYVFTAKNAAGATVDTKTVTTGATTANYEFNQAAAGNYSVSVVVNTTGGATNPADCTKQVTVDEENAKIYKCDALDVKQISRTRYDFTAKASVQNATIQNYVFTAKKDNNTVDTKTVTTGATSADYQFDQSAEGTYVVSVVVNTTAGATNPADCTKQVTVVKEGQPPVPPTTPPSTSTSSSSSSATSSATSSAVSSGGAGAGGSAATALPATGPTDVAAVVTLVTTVSTIGYYVVTRRFI